jgi:two-component system response regulator NreC
VTSDALRRAIASHETERRRLARELHEETGQALTSILLGLKRLEEQLDAPAVAPLRELVVATLQDVRRLAVELRPKALDDFGLAAAIARLAGEVALETGIEVDCAGALGGLRLPDEVETALYRIAQEALTNAVRHAHARRVSILLTRKDGGRVRGDRGRRARLRPGPTPRGRARARRDARACRAARRTPRDRVGRGRRDDGRRRRPGAVTIRILIVDDHAVVRAGLRLLLDAEEDIETVGEAGDAREAVFEARATAPDVILMDIVMPDQSGLEALPTLLHEHPETRVLILSMQDDPRYVREAFAAGASGYVLKEAADVEVVGAIREVARGGRYVHPELGARLVAAEAEAERRAEADPLSDREREVLRLLALGHTNQEIAKQLYISVRTAETHRAHIMQKLRLGSRAELVRYAIAHGLLDEEE